MSFISQFDRTNRNGSLIKSWGFQTIGHEEFCPIANIFFDQPSSMESTSEKIQKSSKKIITPGLVENYLTPTGLAYWFMDDGSKMDHTKNEGKGFHIHTQGFEEEEVESLCNGLEKRYGLKCWKVRNKGKYVIAISGRSYEKFVDLIKPNLLPCMQYKIPSERQKK